MIQTYCEMHGIPEVHTLEKGMDLRKPEYRKEFFFRFYEFHTKYGIHPGLVYLFLPKMAEHENWNMEQRLWVAFLEGCCENPCTVWQITRDFPELPRTEEEIQLFEKWHAENWKSLCYDIDTRYNKGHLVEQIQSYVKHLNGSTQEDFFHGKLFDADKKKWFDKVWEEVTSFYKYGRLTSWSYIEFIKILSGFDYEYSSLKMSDLSGSKSHRNGCLRVMGRDDLEWWSGANNGVTTHSKELCADVEQYGQQLTEELKARYGAEPWGKYIGYETVESALCAFKNSFHGRRYSNIYTDMSYDRIKKAEQAAPKVDFSIFWKMREDNLPEKLLLEKNPSDPGLKPEKQEFFRNTGHMPMISVLDPVFECEWDTKYYGDEVDTFFN